MGVAYTYNVLNQLSRKTTKVNGSDYFYNALSYHKMEGSRNSSQVRFFNYRKSGTDALIRGFEYAYDANGNIKTVSKTATGDSILLETYGYDNQNQLVRCDSATRNKSLTYTYDTVGNIRSRSEYAYTTGTLGEPTNTHTYTYGNSQWRDLLTEYDGQKIAYEGQTYNGESNTVTETPVSGNPTRYYNGSDYTFTWDQGRQLATAVKGNKAVSYEYDMAGVLSSKTVITTNETTGAQTSKTYKYTTLSGKLIRQECGNQKIDFIYDDSNQPYAFTYKSSKNATPVTYYYLLNQQGDIEAIMNATGTIVVRYEYDPWGAVTVKKGDGTVDSDASSIGNINPLRYRGYYYDTETGFYYLQSRYYDPVIGRFISADTFATTDVTGVLSANMFAYCKNNPVQYEDKDGNSATLAGAVVGGVWGTISGMAAGLPLEGVFQYAVSGALTGAAAGFVADLTVATCGAGAAMLWSALGSGTMNVVNSFATHNIDKKFLKDTSEYTFADKAIDFLVGGLTGGLFAGMSAKGPVVKGIKTGLSHVKNMITTELFQFSMGLNKMFIKAFSFDFVSSFLGAISNWFGTNHLKHQYVGSGTRGHR